MKITLHQTHHKIGDFDERFRYLQQVLTAGSTGPEVHVFPELFLTGYPLQDLCLQKPFIDAYTAFCHQLESFSQSLGKSEKLILLGGLAYSWPVNPSQAPLTLPYPLEIRNAMFSISPGSELKEVYTKRLLPNYDIFDERKYFAPGTKPGLIEFAGKNLGLMICEDMWFNESYGADPCEELHALTLTEKRPLDLIINISASPYDLNKHSKRLQRAETISALFQAPFVYVNQVGGEDEILFDGKSFICAGAKTLWQGEAFSAQKHTWHYEKPTISAHAPKSHQVPEHAWEGLFSPRVQFKQNVRLIDGSPLVELMPWTKSEGEELLRALCFGLHEYAQKNNMKRFNVACSGGVDSALVLALVKLTMKTYPWAQYQAEAIYMPGTFSAGISFEISEELCQNLEIPLKLLPIKFLHKASQSAYSDAFGEKLKDLADENIQARLRGMLLYSRSNSWGSMVINTSNKSELAVGYSTLYGDSVGALSLIGDLYKSEVYWLCDLINSMNTHPWLPQAVIDRAPSAELRDNQKDSDSLPPYSHLDVILELLLSYRAGFSDILKMGFTIDEITRVMGLYAKSEYKRQQFCPILKVKSKSFGFGHRVPISKYSDFYTKL